MTQVLKLLLLLTILIAIENATADNVTAKPLLVVNESNPVAWYNKVLLSIARANTTSPSRLMTKPSS